MDWPNSGLVIAHSRSRWKKEKREVCWQCESMQRLLLTVIVWLCQLALEFIYRVGMPWLRGKRKDDIRDGSLSLSLSLMHTHTHTHTHVQDRKEKCGD
jgi:hypothetical protein